FNYKFDRWGRGRNVLVGFSALLMLYIGFLFSHNWTLALTPERWHVYFAQPGGTNWNLAEPTLWPRYLHMVFGAMAVAGLGLAAFGRWKQDRGHDVRIQIDHGMAWFKWTTLLQMGLGVWWLIALRPEAMKLFMGGNMVATMAFGLGFGLSIVALLCGFLKKVWLSVGATVATLLAMAVMREYVRYGYLKAYFTPADLEVDPQVSPLILFLVSLAVGIGCIWYMLKLALNAGKEA
ncbi:hypothetical protein CSB20_02020, partial [bacterium DOLZORAL124_64_63]